MEKASPLRISGLAPFAEPLRFSFDGVEFSAFPGETVAGALWAAGQKSLSDDVDGRTPRGAFCFMGSCQECVVETNDGLEEACRLVVTAGLMVRRVQRGGDAC